MSVAGQKLYRGAGATASRGTSWSACSRTATGRPGSRRRLDRSGGERERGHGAVHGGVEDGDDISGLLDRVDEADEPPVEAQVGKLDEDGVAHGVGAASRRVGQ